MKKIGLIGGTGPENPDENNSIVVLNIPVLTDEELKNPEMFVKKIVSNN